MIRHAIRFGLFVCISLAVNFISITISSNDSDTQSSTSSIQKATAVAAARDDEPLLGPLAMPFSPRVRNAYEQARANLPLMPTATFTPWR